MADEAGRTGRGVELLRGGWGLTLLVAPRLVLRTADGLHADRKALVVTRILGARHLTQALLSGLRPSPEVLAMGAWVDAVHSLTAAGLAVSDPRRARAGLTDTGVAAVWAGFGLHDLRHARATPPEHQRRRDRMADAVLAVAPGGRRLLADVERDRRRSVPRMDQPLRDQGPC